VTHNTDSEDDAQYCKMTYRYSYWSSLYRCEYAIWSTGICRTNKHDSLTWYINIMKAYSSMTAQHSSSSNNTSTHNASNRNKSNSSNLGSGSGMDYMTKADFIFHTAYESINALRQFYMKRWLTFFYTNSECIKSPYQYRQWFAFSMLCFNYLEYF